MTVWLNERRGWSDMKNLKELQSQAHQIAVEKGWWENDRNMGEQIALMHSELSEALEEWRRNPDPTVVWYGYPESLARECSHIETVSQEPTQTCNHRDAASTIRGKPEGFGVELADCVIRILDTCETYGLDLEALIVEKMNYNRTRPYRHGGKSA